MDAIRPDLQANDAGQTPARDLLELCYRDLPDLRPSGQYHKARCPFHDDNTPSFTVKYSRHGHLYFRCFSASCGLWGGLNKYMSLTGRDRNAVASPEPGAFRATEPEEYTRLRQPPPAAVADAMAWHQEQLTKSDEARAYLKKRNISPEQAQKHGLGYCPAGNGLYGHMTKLGYRNEDLIAWGFSRNKRNKVNRDRLRIILPHRNPDTGDTIWYTGRSRTANDKIKYMHMPGIRPALFDRPNPASMKGKSSLIIVEGPFDMLAARNAGFHAAATLGPPEAQVMRRILPQAAPGGVLLLPDNDAAGEQWTKDMACICAETGIPCLTLRLPAMYQDPAQLAAGGNARNIILEMRKQAIAEQKRQNPQPRPKSDL